MKKDKFKLFCENFDELICKDIIFPKNSIVMKMIENNSSVKNRSPSQRDGGRYRMTS